MTKPSTTPVDTSPPPGSSRRGNSSGAKSRPWQEVWDTVHLDFGLQLLADASEQAGIPVEPLGSGGLRLGQGAFQKHVAVRGWPVNSAAATALVETRDLWEQLLRYANIPCVQPELVSNLEQAFAVAYRLGWPVFLKAAGCSESGANCHAPTPAWGRAETPEQLRDVFASVSGAAASVAVLRATYANVYRLLVLDSDVLAFCLITASPASETRLSIHPDNRALAVRAAKAAGLSLATIELLATDIGSSHQTSGGVIGGIYPRVLPLKETPTSQRDRIGAALLKRVAPGASARRVPVLAVAGQQGQNRTAAVVAHLLRASGKTVGLQLPRGLFVNGEALSRGPKAGPAAFQVLSRHPDVEVIVRSLSADEVAETGIGHEFSGCLVLQGLRGIGRPMNDKPGGALKTIRASARGPIVTDADDIGALGIVGKAPRKQVVLFSSRGENAVIREHVQQGGTAVAIIAETTEGPALQVYKKRCAALFLPLARIPALANTQPSGLLEPIAAGVAAAVAMGEEPTQIRAQTLTVKSFRRPLAHITDIASAASLSQDKPTSSSAARDRLAPLWTPEELAAATEGTWLCRPDNFTGAYDITYVAHQAKTGDVVLTHTPKQWGKKFADTIARSQEIFERGAAALITTRAADAPQNRPVLLVENTREALKSLGQYARDRFGGKVITVTGTVGKTSTKTAIAHLLSQQAATTSSRANFNHGPGLPLSLAQTPAGHAYGVYEFAAQGPGIPPKKSKLARPHVGVVTHLEHDHLDKFGTTEFYSDSKAQMFDHLEPGGVAVLYRGMLHFERMLDNIRAKGVDSVIVYGEDADCDVRLLGASYTEHGSEARISLMGHQVRFKIAQPGKHLVLNAMGALAAVYAVGADWQAAARDVETVPWPGRRAQIQRLPFRDNVLTLIEDARSANVASMRSAFAMLGLIQPRSGGRRIAVLSDVNELGSNCRQLHRDFAPPLLASGVDVVHTIGELMLELRNSLPEAVRGRHGKVAAEIANAIVADARPGDVVLVKGYRKAATDPNLILERLRGLANGSSVELAKAVDAKHAVLPAKNKGGDYSLHITFVGDTGFGETYQAQRERRTGNNILKDYGYAYPLQNFATMLSESDLVVANLETPLTDAPSSPFAGKKKYVHWGDPQKTPAALLDHNIKVVTLANNHTFDYGASGFEQTLDVLARHDINAIGGGSNEREATAPLLVESRLEISQFRMAVFSTFDANRRYRDTFSQAATSQSGGLDLFNARRLADRINEIKQWDPKTFVVVCPHWGQNYAWRTDKQKRGAETMLEGGADLILGHGAHMLQEIERHQNRWVIYSIGNFVFNSPGRYAKKSAPPFSLIAQLVVLPDGGGLRLVLRLYPILTDNRTTQYQGRFVTEAELEHVYQLLIERSGEPQMLRKWVRRGHDFHGRFFELFVARRDSHHQ